MRSCVISALTESHHIDKNSAGALFPEVARGEATGAEGGRGEATGAEGVTMSKSWKVRWD